MEGEFQIFVIVLYSGDLSKTVIVQLAHRGCVYTIDTE